LTGVIQPLDTCPSVPLQSGFFVRSASQGGGTFVPGHDYFTACVSVRSATPESRLEAENVMLGWVVTFLIIALIAGVLGFGGVAGASIEIAKAIFFIAVILFIVSAVVGLARGRTRV
jgi:uncharacterized membrane protein YtjA (UPF0391 family)